MEPFEYNDGGRSGAGFKGQARDCVVRAIAIAFQKPYMGVYEELRRRNAKYAARSRSRTAKTIQKRGSTPREGNFKAVYKAYIEELGGVWVSTMAIGAGCKVHLRADELPRGTLIVKVSRHLVAVIDGVINDTHDCSRGGTRCVYGYWIQK